MNSEKEILQAFNDAYKKAVNDTKAKIRVYKSRGKSLLDAFDGENEFERKLYDDLQNIEHAAGQDGRYQVKIGEMVAKFSNWWSNIDDAQVAEILPEKPKTRRKR